MRFVTLSGEVQWLAEKADVTLASIADGVLRTDVLGMVDYLNPVAQKLTGWTLAEAYGRPAAEVYRVVEPQTGKRLLDPLSQCLEKGRESIFVGDRLLTDRDGAHHPVQDSAAPIRDRRGEIIGAVLTFRNLSRLRQIACVVAKEKGGDRIHDFQPGDDAVT